MKREEPILKVGEKGYFVSALSMNSMLMGNTLDTVEIVEVIITDVIIHKNQEPGQHISYTGEATKYQSELNIIKYYPAYNPGSGPFKYTYAPDCVFRSYEEALQEVYRRTEAMIRRLDKYYAKFIGEENE